MSSELTTPQTNFVFSSGGQDTGALPPDSARARHATNRMGSSLLRLSAPRAATRRAGVESTRSIMNSLLNILFRHPKSALAPPPGHPLNRRVVLSTAHRHGRRA